MRGIALTSVLFAGLLWQDPRQLRVDVPLIVVDVTVTNNAGVPVLDLSADDFVVSEDGQQQDIRSFELTQIPYRVLVIWDCPGGEFESLRQGMEIIVNSLRPHSRVAILDLVSGSKVVRDWDQPQQQMESVTLRSTGCVTGYNLVFADKIRLALSKAQNISGRKGIVWFLGGTADIPITYNNERSSGAAFGIPKALEAKVDPAFQDVAELVREHAMSFSFVMADRVSSGRLEAIDSFASEADQHNWRQRTLRLRELAETSGGSMVTLKKPQDVQPVVQALEKERGTTYTLGYVAADGRLDGRWHSIAIRTKMPGMRVTQSRRGYRAGDVVGRQR